MTAQEVTAALRTAIEAEEYLPGHQLPSKKALSQRLGTSMPTVQQAFNNLMAEGHAISRRGAGLFVRQPPAKVTWAALNSGFDELCEQEVVPPRWVAKVLQLPPGELVHRHHQALDDRLQTRWFVDPAIATTAVRAETSLEARAAAPDECELLDLRSGAPVMRVHRLLRDATGRVVRIDRLTLLGAAFTVDLGDSPLEPDHDQRMACSTLDK